MADRRRHQAEQHLAAGLAVARVAFRLAQALHVARRGIDLQYFLDDKGFARKMTAMPGQGPTWISSLVVLPGAKGQERMFAVYVKVRHAFVTGLFGSARTLTDTTVMRIEPVAS